RLRRRSSRRARWDGPSRIHHLRTQTRCFATRLSALLTASSGARLRCHRSVRRRPCARGTTAFPRPPPERRPPPARSFCEPRARRRRAARTLGFVHNEPSGATTGRLCPPSFRCGGVLGDASRCCFPNLVFAELAVVSYRRQAEGARARLGTLPLE